MANSGNRDRIRQLLAALDSSPAGAKHPIRAEVLSTLAGIMLEIGYVEQAAMIHRDVLEYRVRCAGAHDPKSLAAKGDLAVALSELGKDDESIWLEEEAFASARAHFGRTHAVTCVLAWNRALSYERRRDQDSARELIASELVWLLVEDPSNLEAGQNVIRALLAERLNWDIPTGTPTTA